MTMLIAGAAIMLIGVIIGFAFGISKTGTSTDE